jgi:hypothetical protein
MPNGDDLDDALGVRDRVKHAVDTYTKAILLRTAKFSASSRPWFLF